MFGDLPDLALETIYFHLSLRERARAELVCKRWLACSRSSTLLWGRVEWGMQATSSEPPEAMEWLATRPGVTPREASLRPQPYSDREDGILMDCLAAWSSSLRALELSTGDFLPSSEAWAPSLSRLTQLHLRYRAWSGLDAAFVANLRSLRTLWWGVYMDDPSEEEAWLELPTPPQLEHLAVYGPGWRLPAQLAAMTQLQTLDLYMVDVDDLNPALPPSLTWLSYGSLPTCLSSLTDLHYLSLSFGPSGTSPAAQACLAQALRCLRSLEYLRLDRCQLEELPPLSQLPQPPPLRALAIQDNNCTLTDAGWLATLETLTCGWHQLPDPQLSAMAPRLQEVSLMGHGWHDKVAGDVAARGLASMHALPALRLARFDSDRVEWTEPAKAALEVLSKAKPQLKFSCLHNADYGRHAPGWPNPDARFMLGAPA